MFAWITANWPTITIGFGILWALVSFVVGLTPSPKDDAFLAKIAPFLSFLQPKDAPGTVKAPLSPPAAPVPIMVERADGSGVESENADA